jgi:hypothetical protein
MHSSPFLPIKLFKKKTCSIKRFDIFVVGKPTTKPFEKTALKSFLFKQWFCFKNILTNAFQKKKSRKGQVKIIENHSKIESKLQTNPNQTKKKPKIY